MDFAFHSRILAVWVHPKGRDERNSFFLIVSNCSPSCLESFYLPCPHFSPKKKTGDGELDKAVGNRTRETQKESQVDKIPEKEWEEGRKRRRRGGKTGSCDVQILLGTAAAAV